MRSYYVHFWDTTSWQLLSTTGPFQHGENGDDNADFQLITDDIWIWGEQIFRTGTATPIAKLPGSSLRFLREVVLLDSGQLFETQTWRRRQPPKGRKYHPEIIRFAPDGRFVPVKNDRGEFQFLDTATEETSFTGSFPASTRRGSDGWEDWSVPTTTIPKATCTACRHRINWTFHLTSSNSGPRSRSGVNSTTRENFVKWDEPTWEKNGRNSPPSLLLTPTFLSPAMSRAIACTGYGRNMGMLSTPINPALPSNFSTAPGRWRQGPSGSLASDHKCKIPSNQTSRINAE